MSDEVSQLAALFPNLDRSSLRAALDAHNGNVERSVDYLLQEQESSPPRSNPEHLTQPDPDAPPRSNIVYDSGDTTMDVTRELQMQEDARLARMLQEQEAMYRRRGSQGQTQNGNGIDAVNGDDTWEQMSAMANSAYVKMKLAGKAAYNGIVDLYNSYMTETGTGSNPQGDRHSYSQLSQHDSRNDVAEVVTSSHTIMDGQDTSYSSSRFSSGRGASGQPGHPVRRHVSSGAKKSD